MITKTLKQQMQKEFLEGFSGMLSALFEAGFSSLKDYLDRLEEIPAKVRRALPGFENDGEMLKETALLYRRLTYGADLTIHEDAIDFVKAFSQKLSEKSDPYTLYREGQYHTDNPDSEKHRAIEAIAEVISTRRRKDYTALKKLAVAASAALLVTANILLRLRKG